MAGESQRDVGSAETPPLFAVCRRGAKKCLASRDRRVENVRRSRGEGSSSGELILQTESRETLIGIPATGLVMTAPTTQEEVKKELEDYLDEKVSPTLTICFDPCSERR